MLVGRWKAHRDGSGWQETVTISNVRELAGLLRPHKGQNEGEIAGIVAMGDLARGVIAEQAFTIDQLHGFFVWTMRAARRWVAPERQKGKSGPTKPSSMSNQEFHFPRADRGDQSADANPRHADFSSK
jgi:hypothetical protein